MTRINQVDQVLLLLRQQLQRLDKSGRARKGSASSATGVQRRSPAAGRVEAVLRADDLSDEDLARTLISALLVDEFGEAAANDPAFLHMAGEVHRIIAADPQAAKLLGEAIKGVRGDV
ncbi:hypothetical protein H0274_01010 [Altererythrobacter sp. CC-YST694]|uniref:hypothetical protein n=1 Tax=Altererythrobacter sp. CC-YST694 TaxID=2755038 RepID=UPI001D0321D8|nr:hypothetical protein [Altererythrobacter sp. CC-YST694]MCB5423821.1 hypothetical protein [Altererythrobacter sp. CC-YST694]